MPSKTGIQHHLRAVSVRPNNARATIAALCSTGALLAGSTSAPALAQLEPGTLNPGLLQQQQLELQQQQQAPNVLQEELPPLIKEEPEQQAPGIDDPDLLINQVNIEGAQAISSETIAAVFKPLLGKTIKFSQLQQALNQASNLYRDAGYFTSRVIVPQGALKNGTLRVIAVEGYIEAIEVIGKGSEGLKQWTKYYLSPLVSNPKSRSPIRFNDMERQILLMQSFGGVRFSSTLAQGSSFAASKLIVDLNPQLLSGSISMNNNVQQQLGDYQVAGQLQLNVLSAPQPLQVDLYGSNAFPYSGGLASGVVGFATPIGNRGLKLQGIGSLTSTSSAPTQISDGAGGLLSLRSGGESWLGNIGLSYPILQSRTAALNISLTGEVQNAINNTFLDGLQIVSNINQLRVLRLGLNGSLATPFYASTANLQISQGLPIANAFDSNTAAATNFALPAGSVSYTSARLTLRHQQRIGTTNTYITATGVGQLASTTLPGAEDFSYGGPFLGRAFRGSYIIGDQGAAGGLEVSHGFSGASWNLTPFIFADIGTASNTFNLPTPVNNWATSYGLGVRGGVSSWMNFELGWAVPGGQFPASAGKAGVANSNVYFRAGITF